MSEIWEADKNKMIIEQQQSGLNLTAKQHNDHKQNKIWLSRVHGSWHIATQIFTLLKLETKINK